MLTKIYWGIHGHGVEKYMGMFDQALNSPCCHPTAIETQNQNEEKKQKRIRI